MQSENEIRSHRDLIVWQKAMDLTVLVYKLSEAFPPAEKFRLTSQMTRAAASVPANIAEGNARMSGKDYARFLAIAKGSLSETETYLVLATRLGYLDIETAGPALGLATEISKMIAAIRAKLLRGEKRRI